jgi:hypothetical protein
VRCFHRLCRKHRHLCNRSQHRNNLFSKISSHSNHSHKLNSQRLMVVMHPHQHLIKQRRINSPQQISRHLKMVPQLMRLMVK